MPGPPKPLSPIVPAYLSVYKNASSVADTASSYYVQPDTCFNKLDAGFVIAQSARCADRSVWPTQMAFSDANCSTEMPFQGQMAPFPGCYATKGYAAIAFRCNESVALSSASFCAK
jgi:hypothetical protein